MSSYAGVIVRQLSCMTILTPNIPLPTIREEPNRTFLDKKWSYFGLKLMKQCMFKSNCNCQRKSMQANRICNGHWCELKIPSLRITIWHQSASLMMPNSYPLDGIFNPYLTTIKDSYSLLPLQPRLIISMTCSGEVASFLRFSQNHLIPTSNSLYGMYVKISMLHVSK